MQILSQFICIFGGEPSHYCPACNELHRFYVNTPRQRNGAHWSWDRNVDAPTFSPSMNISIGEPGSSDFERCHYFLKDGQLQYLEDSTHALRGKTVPLPPLPPLKRGGS